MMGSFTRRNWLQVVLVFWLQEYINCQCVIPKFNFLNGKVIYPPLEENSTLAGNASVIEFKCFDGYLRIGAKYIVCVYNDTLETMHWTDSEPFCAGMHCRDPPQVENSTHTIKSGESHLNVGSTALYECKEGHEPQNVNTSSLVCVIDFKSDKAKWEGVLPICKRKNANCPDPGVSKNGERTGPCCKMDDVLQFNCSTGYTLVGNETIMCLQSGRWTSNRPLCKPPVAYCEPPPPIAHGVLVPSGMMEEKCGDYFMIGDWANVECEPGYKYVGRASKCKEGKGGPIRGVWKRPFGKCEEFVCSAPPTLLNGHIPEIEGSNITSFPQNFLITYICNKGFKLDGGDSSRKCGRRGWSGTTPLCEVLKCPDPGSPENGYKVGNDYSLGAIVQFECNGLYELLGSYERQCMPNGQWSGKLARCNIESNYCPDPGKPINGWKNMTHYEMGDRVGFGCSPGLMLLGSEVRECWPNRTWSGKETRCLNYNDYDDQMKVSEILKTEVAKKAEEQKKELDEYTKSIELLSKRRIYAYGNSLDLNYPGRIILYFAFDVSGSIEKENLKKSIDFAKAIVRKVTISENGARAGALTFSSKAEVIFWPMQYNTTEGVLAAMDKINYTGGGTSANSALKAIREDHLPLVREWIPDTKTKSVLFILTDGKANMGGNPKQEAERLKAEGVEIFCVGITGDINQKLLYDIASSSEYGKNRELRPNVFILKNYEVLAWLVHEITNGTIDYSQCGVGLEAIGQNDFGNMMDGEVTKEPWPWMAALFVNDEVPPKFRFTCGGSIIHPRFIVTAAHCLYDKNYMLRDRSKLLVKIGLTDIKNKTQHMYEVRKIIKHSMYDRDGSYDYDIALLELKQPIQFNSDIRPICLPPKVVECPDPGSPENGYKIGNNYSISATVQFECNEDFELLGPHERQCQPDGKWSGTLPSCNINSNYCPDPGMPINGKKNMTEFKMGDRVAFECFPGYVMKGSKVRECLSNRTWSGKETRCFNKTDLYLPDSNVWAAGWGEEKYREVNASFGQSIRFLKEIRLPIKNRDICLESIRDEKPDPIPAEHFSPRMFCVGTGTIGFDLCKGDSGGPVMKSVLDKDGYPRWTQVGIISWGIGCGLELEYAFQTKLQDFRQWIDDKIGAQ